MTSTLQPSEPRTHHAYAAAFAAESLRTYPEVTEYEQRCGFALERTRLEPIARTLACPLKVNPPNWQHGRVLYAAARDYLDGSPEAGGVFLDIGTAKGFSATILSLALADAEAHARVVTVDVIDPLARVPRNSVLEVKGEFLTVYEFMAPYLPKGRVVDAVGGGSVKLLNALARDGERIRFAFVDGKHSAQVVGAEIDALTRLQHRGDIAVFDDLQIPGVSVAVRSMLSPNYAVEYIEAGTVRRYAVATRQ